MTSKGAHSGRVDHPLANDDLLYRAAVLYYQEDATQADVAARLGVSRPTVSRLLSQARSRGIVTIEVRRPRTLDTDILGDLVREALGLKRVWVSLEATAKSPGLTLAQSVKSALAETELGSGEGLLVSPGQTLWEVASQPMPSLPGTIVAPTAGGTDEPEAYYQTNEITRLFAATTGGQPWFLYAPAMPAPAVYDILSRDPSINRVFALWDQAQVALLGIGAPPATRTTHPSVLPKYLPAMSAAVGDICLRPFDRLGHEIPFPGSDRLVSMELEQLHRLEWAIGVACGPIKSASIVAAARGGHINALVTDAETASAIVGDVHNTER